MALYDLAAKLNMGDKYFAQCIRDAMEGKDEQLGILASKLGMGEKALGDEIRAVEKYGPQMGILSEKLNTGDIHLANYIREALDEE